MSDDIWIPTGRTFSSINGRKLGDEVEVEWDPLGPTLGVITAIYEVKPNLPAHTKLSGNFITLIHVEWFPEGSLYDREWWTDPTQTDIKPSEVRVAALQTSNEEEL